jgi:VIT1/CCC1 family predicted Fe2+/Mn2+ transporter
MSSEEQDEKREYVSRESTVGTSGGTSEVVIHERPTGQTEVIETSPSVKRESVVKRKSTNTAALVGIVVGIAVLISGMFLVLREAPFLPYPLSLIVIVVVGIALIGVGASMVSSRSTTR